MGKFIHSTIFVQATVFLIVASMVSGKISGKIDLAIIVPASHLRDFIDGFKPSLAKLPQLTDIADNKVRVVVFDCITKKGTKVKDADLLFALSGDKAAFDAFVSSWDPYLWDRTTWYHHDIALNKLREEVFDFNDVTRAKVVIMIMNGFAADRSATREAARKLREKGVFVYVIFHRELRDKDYSLAEEIEDYVSHKEGKVKVGSSNHQDLYRQGVDHIAKLENVLARDLCTGCLIGDSGLCSPGRRPVSSKLDFYGDNNALCQTVDPTPDLKCPKERCESECDYEWPWSEACNEPCKTISRNPPQPPPNGMENCPPTRTCPGSCPSTTEPSTTAPTTPPTLASTTDSVVVPTSAASPSDKSSTTPSTNSSGDPGAGGPAPGNEGGSGGLSLGVIIGIVIGVLVVLAILLIIVIVLIRKKKKTAKEKMVKKPEEGKGSKSVKPSPSAKSTTAKTESSFVLDMASKGKGANTSVMADMPDMTVRPKGKGKIGASPKGKTGASMKAGPVKKK